MAFNWQTFRTRTLTAAVFVVVMLVGLLWNHWSFFILFSIIHFGCWWEYLKLVEKINNTVIGKFSKFLLMDVGYVLFWLIGFKDHETPGLKIASTAITISQALILLMLTGVVAFFIATRRTSSKVKWMSLIGFIYISLSLGLMLNLRNETVYDNHLHFYFERGKYITVGLVYIIWINDTLAYIVGSLIGRTPLSPISPKKTWEGSLGGILLCSILIGISSLFVTFSSPFSFLPYWIHLGGNWYSWVVIAVIATIVGTFGDLLESKLKRIANVKDSGHIMPGHGGFLDRFDSMLLAIPAVWLYVYLLMR